MTKYLFFTVFGLLAMLTACEKESDGPDDRKHGVTETFSFVDPLTGQTLENVYEGRFLKTDVVQISFSSSMEIEKIEVTTSLGPELYLTKTVNGTSTSFEVAAADLNLKFAQYEELYIDVHYNDKGDKGFDYNSSSSFTFKVYDGTDATIARLHNEDGTVVSLKTTATNLESAYADNSNNAVYTFLGDGEEDADPAYLTVEEHPDLQFGASDFTVSFWIQSNHEISDPALIGDMDWDSSNNTGWLLAWKNGYIRAVVTNREDENNESKTSLDLSGEGTPLLGDEWHQVAVVADRDGKLSIYIDGQLAGEKDMEVNEGQPIVNIDNDLPVNINQDGTGSYGDHLTAQFRTVAFYTYALSAQEIMDEYNRTK